MSGVKWPEVERWFHDLSQLDLDEREAQLAELAAQRPELAATLVELLAASEGVSEALPAGGALDGRLHQELQRLEERSDDLVGSVVAQFRLVEVLGRGGMSVVYLGEHIDPKVPQRAAIKVLRSGHQSPEQQLRFEQELAILARLEHPSIARFLHGGTSPDQVRYIAMELVDGQPIDDYCATHGASLEERLSLLQSVAEAVQYAHSHLVVHRDLKPANVLVTHDGRVKLLDFGIAKLTGEARLADGPETQEFSRLLTPEYCSPEQVRGEPVSMATDVYLLGLLCYEILSGKRAQQLEGRSWSDVERVVCTQTLTPPSVAAADPAEYEPPVPTSFAHRLRGDLDNIVLTALRKEPERRYRSVGHLLDDLERFQRSEPVSATPDGRWYRLSKFWRRHRLAVAAATAVILLSIGYATTVTLQARRLAAERDRVRAEAVKSEMVKDFMADVFIAADPFEAAGTQTTAGELLERASERIDSLDSQPEVVSELRLTLGNVLYQLGSHQQAEEQQRAAVDKCSSLPEQERAGCLPAVEFGLGRTLRMQGEYDEAAVLLSSSVTGYERLLPDSLRLLAEAHNELGMVYYFDHQYERAEAEYREALRLHQSADPISSAAIAGTTSNLSMIVSHRGDIDESLKMKRAASALWEEAVGPDHPHIAIVEHNIARDLQKLGRYSEADPHFRRSLAIRQATLDADHPRLALAEVLLGNNLHKLERFEEAEEHLIRGLAATELAYPDDHPRVAEANMAYGRMLVDAERLDEAAALLERAVDVYQARYGDEDSFTAVARMSLGACYLDLGELVLAERLLTDAERVLRDHNSWGAEARRHLERLRLLSDE